VKRNRAARLPRPCTQARVSPSIWLQLMRLAAADWLARLTEALEEEAEEACAAAPSCHWPRVTCAHSRSMAAAAGMAMIRAREMGGPGRLTSTSLA
jgi:hypothetical protein